MNQKDWNCAQIDEILSKENKYFFWKVRGRPHNNIDELAEFYVSQGGADNFARKHSTERQK